MGAKHQSPASHLSKQSQVKPYICQISQRNNEKISGAHSDAEIRKATIRLLRTIILLTQTLDHLPDDVMMTMKLLYYDDVTPADYEPPGFKKADSDNFVFEDEPMTIKVGDVSTNYHSVKVRVKTDRKQFNMKEQSTQEGVMEHNIDTEIDAGLDQDTHIEENNRKTLHEKLGVKKATPITLTRIQKEPLTDADVPTESPAKPDEPAVNVIGSQASQVTDPEEEFKVRCPCGCNEDDGLMIMCAVCKLWQHGVCFLIVDEDDAPENHVCDVCAKSGEANHEPTDDYLTELPSIQVQATCLWRRTLVACLDLNRVLAPVLAKRLGTEMTVAQGLMNRLDKEGFLKNAGKGKKLGKLVDKDKIIKIGIPMYMQKHEKSKVNTSEQEEQCGKDKADNDNTSTLAMETASEVDQLAEKTRDIKLNKKDKLSRKKRNKKEKNEENKESQLQEVESVNTNTEDQLLQAEKDKKRKGRKRAVSKRDEDREFEISSTQDVYDDPKRRKKASIVHKDIMV